MVRVGGLLEVAQMARGAGDREALVLADGRTLMAILTQNSGVRPEKRKAVIVTANLLHGDVPAGKGVALLAIGTELSAMDISVAIRAVFADVREHRLSVALDAFHFVVQAAQRVTCFAVIEFDVGAERSPSGGVMAVFAGNIEFSVRTTASPLLAGRGGTATRMARKKQQPAQELKNRNCHCPCPRLNPSRGLGTGRANLILDLELSRNNCTVGQLLDR